MEAIEECKDFLERLTAGSVPTVMYIPDFITGDEEAMLLNNVYNAPVSKWKLLKNRRLQNWGGVVHTKGLLQQDLPSWLTRITHRIFEKSGLFPSAINHVLINEYLPNQGIMPHQDGSAYYPVVAILSLGSSVVMDFIPHSSLGQSIETSENFENWNMGSEVPLDMSSAQLSNDHNNQPFSVVMMPRSLLIFKDKAYSDYLHGITDNEVQQIDKCVNLSKMSGSIWCEPAEIDNKDDESQTEKGKFIHRTKTRISLTCRLVTKTHKNLFRI